MRRMPLLCGIGLGLAALCATSAMPDSLHDRITLVYNPTSSVARGWYWVDRSETVASLSVGSIVLAQLPPAAAAFASARGYLPRGIPILKRVGAAAPQTVCVRGHVVLIDDVQLARTMAHDGALRPLRNWPECRRLRDDELFLLSPAHPSSFDSRYFGPIAASQMIGRARALWTWDE